MTSFSGITNDLYPLPPRGFSKGVARIGEVRIEQWTYLCEVEDCHAVGYSTQSAEAAKGQTDSHSCPAPLRRGVLPMGKSLLEKTWDTADEAIDAFRAGTYYLDEECVDDKLKYYIMALAEVLTYFTAPHYRLVEDVLRELQRRWKMRQGLLPFSPTPGYRFHPMPSEYAPMRDRDLAASKATTSKATKRARPKVQATAVEQVAMRKFTTAEVEFIYESVYGGNKIPTADLASMFAVDESRILAVAGPMRTPGVSIDLFGPML